MSNLRTMVERIASEVQRHNMSDEIHLCIIDAIEFLKSEEDRFNEDAWSFLAIKDIGLYKFQQVIIDSGGYYLTEPGGAGLILAAGGGTVGLSRLLPHDWLAPIGPVWLHIADDDNNYHELETVSYEVGDRQRYQAGTSTSYAYTVYWEPDGLRLVPPPNISGDRISGRYKKRMFAPTASWTGSAWVFDSGDATSEWFSSFEAERLVRSKAVALLYENYIDNPERMIIKQAAVERLLTDKREDDSSSRSTNQIEPWGFYTV